MSAREAAAAAVDSVCAVGQRLALGTGLLLHGAGGWLAPEDSGKRFVLRSGVGLVGVAFFGQLLVRAPHLIVAVPVGWLLGAWRVSDSSATPPPGGGPRSRSEQAGQGDEFATTLVRREGMLIYLTPDADNPVRTHVEVEQLSHDDCCTGCTAFCERCHPWPTAEA